jgi:hypothetical protein
MSVSCLSHVYRSGKGEDWIASLTGVGSYVVADVLMASWSKAIITWKYLVARKAQNDGAP